LLPNTTETIFGAFIDSALILLSVERIGFFEAPDHVMRSISLEVVDDDFVHVSDIYEDPQSFKHPVNAKIRECLGAGCWVSELADQS
jgi:hypothetical protein